RLGLAYVNLVEGAGLKAANAKDAVSAAYERGETDEFVQPTAIAGYAGMRDGDGLIMANFRADRVRQLMTALLDPDFAGFVRARRPNFAATLGMSEYATELNRFHAALFPSQELRNTLRELVA